MNVFDYFFEHSKKQDKKFLLGSKESIDYKELYNKCIKLSRYLQTEIGVHQNVILIANNSLFFIISYLSILKSGNVVVPINPEIEQRNLDYILEKCESALIFTTLRYAQKLHFKDIEIITEEKLSEILHVSMDTSDDQHQDISQDILFDDRSLAEIIFTSGSTGEPKGVMISHGNLIANTSSICEYLQLTSKDIMLVILPFYYCYGLSLLHTHIRVGGSIVLNNMFIMLGNVIKDIKEYHCTGFAGVPSHFQILLRKSDSFKTTKFPSLKYVTQAGGKLHDVFIREFQESHPEIRFNVMYGQTEATARLSWLPPEKLSEKIGSCGKAIPGVELKIINETGKDIKPGEMGEIIAFGKNIMAGYYKDKDSTDNIIKDSWLHTGDLATIDHEGFIYLTARKKEIIKVGGRRVSPKEIEEVIVSMPDVIDCTIASEPDEILGERIKAIVTVKDSSYLNDEKLKLWCASKLTFFKIPHTFVIKDKISMSPSGKKVYTK